MSNSEGRYSNVSRRMWGDERFRSLSAAKPNAQTLWVRLLTGPELGCVPGLFAAREGGLADALGWPLAAFRRCWKEIEDAKMATADWRAGIVWVPKSLDHNPPHSPNVVLSWKVSLKELPESKVKASAMVVLGDRMRSMGKSWAEAFTKASGQPMANQEQEQEQEQKQEPPNPPASDETFAMHAGWTLDPDVRATLEVEMIPGWMIDEIVDRARTHYVADKADKRRGPAWNQAVAKWVRRDFKDPNKRPKRHEPDAPPPKPDRTPTFDEVRT